MRVYSESYYSCSIGIPCLPKPVYSTGLGSQSSQGWGAMRMRMAKWRTVTGVIDAVIHLVWRAQTDSCGGRVASARRSRGWPRAAPLGGG